jgi:RNA 2',3'-cyclic 3'-phosphodiesterase
MTPEKRLFVALLPEAPERAAIAQLVQPLAGFRWTPPAHLHLTLRFIGEVPGEVVARTEEILRRVRVEPFWLELAGVGRFPPRGAASVVWVGCASTHPRLHQLRQQVDDALLSLGLPLELPPFVPHLTIARVREAAPGTVNDFLKRHRDFTGPAWPVRAFALMESARQPAGINHEVLRAYPLSEC